MTFSEIFNNIKEYIKLYFIKYAYIYSPIAGLIIYNILKNLFTIKLSEGFISNLINVSGILAGFLFTSLGMIIALPDNKFTMLLKENGYMKIIYNSMMLGIVSLLISMLIGMFNLSESMAIIFFIVGISETFLSAYYLYRVSYFSGKSK